MIWKLLNILMIIICVPLALNEANLYFHSANFSNIFWSSFFIIITLISTIDPELSK